MRPSIHQLRVFGPRNGFIVDQDQETLIKLRGGRYKSYAESFIPPVMFASQYVSNLKTNVGAFLSKDLHVKSGMKYLIESFYRSIDESKPLPIPYREILLTTRIMDKIFDQISPGLPSSAHQR